ncbi:MAG: DUF5663 domain-containing protein [Patescibacteria group bacterium]|nr:DUF5663 domain-containing protein [Patescibacteria group bacterium]
MNSKSNLFTDEEIQNILDQDLLELMGAKDMPEEKKQELYQKMAETVQDRVIARIDDQLSETQREEWLKVIDENDKNKMETFLKSKNIDIAKMLVEEAIIYKTEMMSLFKKSGEK